jgi:hypothetical protein
MGKYMKKVLIAAIALMLYASAPSAFGGATIQTIPIVEVGNVTAKLVRNKNSLSISGTVYNLQPGETYTVWWITFDPGILVLNASGGIANGAGELHFAGSLMAGSYDFDNHPRQVLAPGTLADPSTAFVIFDVVSHGPRIPGRVREQTSTIDGGCDVFACDIVASLIFAH